MDTENNVTDPGTQQRAAENATALGYEVKHEHDTEDPKKGILGVIMGTVIAIGVCFGDNGTSPVYGAGAMYKAFGGDTETVLGWLSLIVLTVTLKVTLQYGLLIMATMYKHVAGIFAFMSWYNPEEKTHGHKDKTDLAKEYLLANVNRWAPVILPIIIMLAAAMEMADGMVTPAISSVAAVEGFTTLPGGEQYASYVVPTALLFLVILGAVQRFGTAKLGSVFGIYMVLFFAVMLGVGQYWLWQEPMVLKAVNPAYAFHFLQGLPFAMKLLAISLATLVATGGEAMFADAAHLGVRSVRLAWFGLVKWAVLSSYAGQAAYVIYMREQGLEIPQSNPYFGMVRSLCESFGFNTKDVSYIMTAYTLLTIGAVFIASQAMLTGSYTNADQAAKRGYMPWFLKLYTSAQEAGQIYLPRVRTFMLLGSAALILYFKNSDAMAAAYGLTVTGSMTVATICGYGVWKYVILPKIAHPLVRIISSAMVNVLFLLVFISDLMFFFSNVSKIPHGAWTTGLMALILFGTMMNRKYWQSVKAQAYDHLPRRKVSDLLDLEENGNRTTVVLSRSPITSESDGIPFPLEAHLRRFGLNPSRHIVIYTWTVTEADPYNGGVELYNFNRVGQASFTSVVNTLGFKQQPDAVADLLKLRQDGQIHIPSDQEQWLVIEGQDRITLKPVQGLLLRIQRWFRNISLGYYRFMERGFGQAPNRYMGLRETDIMPVPVDLVV
jgi:KUP system potassium uptake protein